MTIIILAGYIAGHPMAGHVAVYLQYLLGLRKLGYDVYFLEDNGGYGGCYDPIKMIVSPDCSFGVNYLSRLMKKYGFEGRWAYRDFNNNKHYGLSEKETMQLCHNADIWISIGWTTPFRPEYGRIKNKIYLDLDPAFTQIQAANGDTFLDGYDKFFTVGMAVANGESPLSNLGIAWKDTKHPVVVDLWKSTPFSKNGKFTTLMNWKSYAPVVHKDEEYGLKDIEFMKILELPKKHKSKFEVAISEEGLKQSATLLKNNGWHVADGRKTTLTITSYKQYIQKSKAEFSVAKNGYVKGRTGWFSDRSACYLASGKPVILQETGFSKFIPKGKGLFSFNNMQEAIDAVNEVNRDYEFHCREARKIAEKYFDSDKVLGRMLKQCGI